MNNNIRPKFYRIIMFCFLSLLLIISILEGCKKPAKSINYKVRVINYPKEKDPNLIGVGISIDQFHEKKYTKISTGLVEEVDDNNNIYKGMMSTGYDERSAKEVTIVKGLAIKKSKAIVEVILTATEQFELQFKDFPSGKLQNWNTKEYYNPPYIFSPGEYILHYYISDANTESKGNPGTQ